MDRPLPSSQAARIAWRVALAALLAAGAAGTAGAQPVTADVKPDADAGTVTPASGSSADKLFPYQSDAMPLGCYGCGGGCGGCSSCGGGCGGPSCVPGRLDCCNDCEGHSMFSRLLCGLHKILCCPDPCYEPCYIPAANSAFFLDAAKPVTQMSFRYDAIVGGPTPTQGGYFWKTAGGPGNVPFVAHDLVMENEMAIERFSLFVNTPFRIVNGTNGAGYSDMRIGTKSLLLDSELLLGAFQFTTYLPTGIPGSGTGNGNVGLEPAALFTLKVMDETYVQAELAEWIGILTQQSVFHYHLSVNHTLTAPRKDMQLVGTIEYGQYVFPGAANFYNVGPGLRFFFCRTFDVGFGMQFNVGVNHYYNQDYRTEVRWRF